MVNVEQIAKDLLAEIGKEELENQLVMRGMRAGVVQLYNRIKEAAELGVQPGGETQATQSADSPDVQGSGDQDQGA